MLLLGVELSRGLALITSEGDEVTWVASSRWLKEFCLGTVWSLGTENHTVTDIFCKCASLEIAEYYTHCTGHLLNWYKLLKATCNGANLTVTDVNLFVVELFTVGVWPDFNNLSNSEIHHRNVWKDWLIRFLCRCRLLGRVLYLLLLWRILFLFLWLLNSLSLRLSIS